MFLRCYRLAPLDASRWDTSNVTDMGGMFLHCSSLSSLDLSGWDTSKVKYAGWMFGGCSSLTSVKVGSGCQYKEDIFSFPEPTNSKKQWWSVTDSCWYTKGQIDSSRSGKADTYLRMKPGAQTDIAGASVTYSPSVLKYDNGWSYPEVVAVVLDGEELVEGRDYTWEGKRSSGDAVEYVVTVRGTGDYEGQQTRTFVGVKGESTIALADQSKEYTGKALAYSGKVTKTGSSGGATYAYYSDAACTRQVAAANVKAVGTYYVRATLAADANFEGATSAPATFKITAVPTPAPKPAPAKTFPDVPAGAWYAGVVGRAAGLGLINGYKDGRFGPNDNVTRGQVAVILWNMAGKPSPKGAPKSFPDVKSGKYYYDAVCWASSVASSPATKAASSGRKTSSPASSWRRCWPTTRERWPGRTPPAPRPTTSR